MSRARLVGVALVLGSAAFVPSVARAQCQPGWSDGFDRPGFSSEVLALLRFDDGSGPALYAGGYFNRIDGMPAPGIGRWDGSSWSIPGTELEGYFVTCLTVFDDGTGPALYAGGRIRFTGSSAFFNTVARWDGTSWTPVGPGSTNSNEMKG